MNKRDKRILLYLLRKIKKRNNKEWRKLRNSNNLPLEMALYEIDEAVEVIIKNINFYD